MADIERNPAKLNLPLADGYYWLKNKGPVVIRGGQWIVWTTSLHGHWGTGFSNIENGPRSDEIAVFKQRVIENLARLEDYIPDKEARDKEIKNLILPFLAAMDRQNESE